MGESRKTSGERLAAIRHLLARNNSVTIPELAQRFGVSEMTARRDLDRLEQLDQIKRTHGGAVISDKLVFEFDFKSRRKLEQKAKQAIAREARKLVQPGHRIILDTGTTTLELACLLKNCEDLTVITPSLAVASELRFAENIQVILLGGIIHQNSPDLTGVVTEHCLDLFSADIAFQGADAIGDDGAIYNADLSLAQVDRKMREISRSTCILADSTKVGGSALARNGCLSEADTFVSDERLDRADRKRFRKMGPSIIIAKL